MDTINIILPLLIALVQVIFLAVLIKVIIVVLALPKQIKSLEQRIARLERKD